MNSEPKWDWNDRSCIAIFFELFGSNMGIEGLADELRRRYAAGPTAHKLYGLLAEDAFRTKLEELFGKEPVHRAFELYISRKRRTSPVTLSKRPGVLRLLQPLTAEDEKYLRFWEEGMRGLA